MELKSNPLISVILPVYNGEKYILQAIESVLRQTYRNIELIIINDGSTDSTLGIIEKIKDKRIKLINNDKNIRLPKTLNVGIKAAQGKYIARMDADDICLPERLRFQCNFLEDNIKVGLCGTNISIIDKDDKLLTDKVWGDKSPPLEWGLLWENPLAHSTVMMRRDILNKYNLEYRDMYSEDSDLWCRIALKSRVVRLDEVLLKYRYRKDSEFNLNRIKHLEAALKVSENYASGILLQKPPENFKALTVFHDALKIKKEHYDYKDFKLQLKLWEAIRNLIEFKQEENEAIMFDIYETISSFQEEELLSKDSHIGELRIKIEKLQREIYKLKATDRELHNIKLSRSYKLATRIRSIYKFIIRGNEGN